MPTASLLQKVSFGFSWIYRERPRVFNNPIISRELLVQLRKKQSFACLFLFLIAGTITFLFCLNQLLVRGIFYDEYEQASRIVLTAVMFVEGTTILIFAPLFSATSINLEEERETWDLLRTTPLHLTSIIFGKYLSSLFFVWIVMVSTLPLFSFTMPIGGVSPEELLGVFLMFTEGTLIASLMGLYCSIRWKRTLQSLSMTYLFCFLYFFLLPIFPIIASNDPNLFTLTSPMMPFVYFLCPPGMFGNLFSLSDRQALGLHFFIFAFTFSALIALCIFQMLPAEMQRMKEYFRRKAIVLGRFPSNRYFLITMMIVLWILVLMILYYFSAHPITVLKSSSEIFIVPLFLIILMSGLVFIPYSFTVHYQLLWERKPWNEVDSTPKGLRRFIIQNLKQPFVFSLLWTIYTIPLFVLVLMVKILTITQMAWSLFFLAETFFLSAMITLTCSLITRSIFLSSLYSYGIIFLLFVFIPETGFRIDSRIESILSPFWLTLLPFQRQYWNTSMSSAGCLLVHFLLMFFYFEIAIAFCERRILLNSGKYERESLRKWFLRTLRNQIPQVQLDPKADEVSFFPDRKNPIREKECRDFTLYRRTSFVKSLAGFFLTSALLFLFLPVMNADYYDNLYGMYGLRFPLIMTSVVLPFFILPYAANIFRKEHDQSTWDLISTTTLTPFQMLSGKWRSTLWLFHRRLTAYLIPIFILGFFLGTIGKSNVRFIVSYYIFGIFILYFFALVSISMAVFVSAWCAKTVNAYLLPLIVVFVLQFSPVLYKLAGFHSIYNGAVLSPGILLSLFYGTKMPNYNQWLLCVQTNLIINVVWSLLFVFLTYRSLCKPIERNS